MPTRTAPLYETTRAWRWTDGQGAISRACCILNIDILIYVIKTPIFIVSNSEFSCKWQWSFLFQISDCEFPTCTLKSFLTDRFITCKMSALKQITFILFSLLTNPWLVRLVWQIRDETIGWSHNSDLTITRWTMERTELGNDAGKSLNSARLYLLQVDWWIGTWHPRRPRGS